MVDHIDYSQYKTWNFCKWAWYEKYVLKRQKRWPEGMRDDALAVGSLVHAGLENWYGHQDSTISDKVVGKINPTPEALRLCQGLVQGYIQNYPREFWDVIRTEQPIRFSLIDGKAGLAKIDMYFYLPERTRVESGVPGYEITLNAGWWIYEYKTKSQATKFAEYMRSWQTNMQADFQMLALKDRLSKIGWLDKYPHLVKEPQVVNGLLINIIEKPNTYIAKRKCPECDMYYVFSAWTPKGEKFACPMGHVKALKPLEMQAPIVGNYYRLMVERTQEQLAYSKNIISSVAKEMTDMEQDAEGMRDFVNWTGAAYSPNREKCMDLGARYAQECEFFKAHTYGVSTVDNPDYQDTEDYIGETRTPE